MDMLESNFRRVRAMVSRGKSNTSNTAPETKIRPSVTWADRKEKTSPRPFRRFQQSFRSRETASSASSNASTSLQTAAAAERNRATTCNGQMKLDNRQSPSRFRRFFHSVGTGQSANLPTSNASSATITLRRQTTGSSSQLLDVLSEDNRSTASTQQDYDSQDNLNPTPVSQSVSPNLAAKVLFNRQLSVNFGNVDGEDEMCYGENDFVVECLQWHNVFRERHQAPPLVLSSRLCQSAQAWANTLAHNEMFYHSNPQNSGENLFTRSSCDPEYDVTGRETTVSWYSGIKQYNFNADLELLHVNAGQFTQMVWRESTQLGVGKARTRGGKVLVVAHYRPQGNIFRRFKENVLPERSKSPISSSVEDDDDDDGNGNGNNGNDEEEDENEDFDKIDNDDQQRVEN